MYSIKIFFSTQVSLFNNVWVIIRQTYDDKDKFLLNLNIKYTLLLLTMTTCWSLYQNMMITIDLLEFKYEMYFIKSIKIDKIMMFTSSKVYRDIYANSSNIYSKRTISLNSGGNFIKRLC